MSVTVVYLHVNFHRITGGKSKITFTFAFLRTGCARSISMGNLRANGSLQKSQICLILKLNFHWRQTSTKKKNHPIYNFHIYYTWNLSFLETASVHISNHNLRNTYIPLWQHFCSMRVLALDYFWITHTCWAPWKKNTRLSFSSPLPHLSEMS